jgi:hypothetical protein
VRPAMRERRLREAGNRCITQLTTDRKQLTAANSEEQTRPQQ